MTDFKSGYIAVIGKPNVGKSTIINNLLGEKLNIVTPKPQTTRNNILGILTSNSYQLIFIDTPGIHKPKTLLGKNMTKRAKESLKESDIILFVIDSYGLDNEDHIVINLIKTIKKPIILLINKIDLIDKNKLLPLMDTIKSVYEFVDIIPISATKNIHIDILKTKILEILPNGPKYYPDDQLSNKEERFFVTELIREQVLKDLQEEVPHSIAVKIEEMKDRNPKLSYIKATIYVEKDSHKKIVIGKNGQKLKHIGSLSRKKIESFLNRKIYLELWVKVYKDWRDKDTFLKNIGY